MKSRLSTTAEVSALRFTRDPWRGCQALARHRPGEPDVKAATLGVIDITDEPVAAVPASVGEVVAAYAFRVLREAARQV